MFFFITQIFSHLRSYKIPKCISILWNFGFILGTLFTLQSISGILMAFFYTPLRCESFVSLGKVLNENNFGWYVKYYHSNAVSFYFVYMFLHSVKGIWFSGKFLPWAFFTGLLMILLSIAIAFIGYVLPNGQMSFWGATVISNLLEWLGYAKEFALGGFTVSEATLKRFFVLHVWSPLGILVLIYAHLYFVHKDGGNNPFTAGLNVCNEYFFPQAVSCDLKTLSMVIGFIIVHIGYGIIAVFQADPDNSVLADPTKTPLHIVPEWYLLLFYSTLKMLPTKTSGLLAIAFLFISVLCITEARSFFSFLGTLFSHRVWSSIFSSLAPLLILVGFLGKIAMSFPLILIGYILLYYLPTFFTKLSESVVVRV